MMRPNHFHSYFSEAAPSRDVMCSSSTGDRTTVVVTVTERLLCTALPPHFCTPGTRELERAVANHNHRMHISKPPMHATFTM